jgi:hypothetical protein
MFRLLVLAGALLASACVPPGPAGRGTPRDVAILSYAPPGTRIALRNSVNGRITESYITAGTPTGPRGAYIAEDGTAGGFYPGCWGCGGDMVIDEATYQTLWPLEEGKRAVFLRTAPDGARARMIITVLGTERITTPAGSFETWLLDGRMEQVTGPPLSAQVRAWWAPGPGWVVRAEGGDSRGNTLSSEVTEIIYP